MSPWLQDFACQKTSLRDLVLVGTEGRLVTEADRRVVRQPNDQSTKTKGRLVSKAA